MTNKKFHSIASFFKRIPVNKTTTAVENAKHGKTDNKFFKLS